MKYWILAGLILLLSFPARAQWTETNGPFGGTVTCFGSFENYLFAGTAGGLYRSPDNGANWSLVENGLPVTGISAITVSGQKIITGCSGKGIYFSSDKGNTWTEANTGLTCQNIFSLGSDPAAIYAGTGCGLFISDTIAASWSKDTMGFPECRVNTIVTKGNQVFAGTTGSGVFLTSNHGAGWDSINEGLGNPDVLSLVCDSTKIFAGTEMGGIYSRDLSSGSWSLSDTGLPINTSVTSFSTEDSHIYAGTAREGVYQSTDEGQTWASFNSGLANPWIKSLLCHGTTLCSGTNGGGIFISTADTPSWVSANTGLRNTRIIALKGNESGVYTGTWGAGMFHSDDNGNSWVPSGTGILSPYITSLEIAGNSVFAGTPGMGVFRSTGNVFNWIPVNDGIDNPYINSLTVEDSVIYAGTMGGIYSSDDLGNNWNKFTGGPPVNNITSLLLKNGKIFAGTAGEGIYFSGDNGNSWSQRNNQMTSLFILSLGKSGNNILAGTEEGMFISGNEGLNWTAVDTPLSGNPVSFISSFNSAVFSGSPVNGIVLSQSDGNSWIPLNEGLGDTSVNDVAVSLASAYAGTTNRGVWKRPVYQIFPLDVTPDTLFLSQFAGKMDSVLINTPVSWSILGTMPDWLACETTTGNGKEYVVFRTLKQNQGVQKKYASFFLYSPVLPSITFMIVQKEKSAGIPGSETESVRIFPVPSNGIVEIESVRMPAIIMVYSSTGKVIREINNPGQKFTLDLSAEGKGLYFLHFEGEGWSCVRKIMIIEN